MKYVVFFLGLFFVLSCKSKTEQTTTDPSEQEIDSERITAKDIESIEYTDYVLSAEAKEAVVNWQRYQDLTMQLEYLKQADFSFFSGKNELLMTFLKDLRSDMPQEVVSPAVKERLIALETKLLKLHSTLKLSTAKKAEILSNIKELLVATSNLHLQMNKKFELESQVIEDPSFEPLPTD